jgi:RNA polymerase sporulation-specific sigma factor
MKSAQILALIGRAHQGDKAARDTVFEENIGLIYSVAKRFIGRGVDLEDLFQIGSIGLLKAVDKFDLSYEVQFSTYAVPMITGEIKRFLRDDGILKISRSLKEAGGKVRQAENALVSQNGRAPTLQELSEATGMPREEIVMALEANGEVESIYKPVGTGDGREVYLADRLMEQHNPNEELLDHMLLGQLLDTLKDMERELIFERYFQGKTQSQVAERLGISQVQVSRLEKKILLQLRRQAEG